MSVISDKLKKTIDKVLNAPTEEIKKNVDIIVKNTRLGKDQGDKIKKVLDTIDKVEAGVETIQSNIEALKSIQKSLEASKTAADTVKKTSVIASALNPAAAAAGLAQEFIIEKFGKEIEDAKNVINIVPTFVANFKKRIKELKDKLRKAQEEKKQKDSIREQRKNNINS